MDVHRRYVHTNPGLYIIGALALLLGAAAPAAAQLSVEVSPLRVELKTAPGGTTTQAITITNTGKDAVRVRATISDWHLAFDGAPQFVPASEANARYSASSWVRIAPPEQVIDSGKDGTVRFSLAVPAEAEAAGYRTSVVFEFGPASGDPIPRAKDILVRSRIATLIYANVGEPPAAVELTDLKTRHAENQPTQIVAVLKNTGKRTIRTRGTLTVYDKTGAKLSETVVPDVPVLPESEREVAITAIDPAKPPLPAGEYRVEVKIDVGMPALVVGETTLKVT